MVKDHSYSERGNLAAFRLAERDICMHHPTDRGGAPAGTRNSSMGPP